MRRWSVSQSWCGGPHAKLPHFAWGLSQGPVGGTLNTISASPAPAPASTPTSVGPSAIPAAAAEPTKDVVPKSATAEKPPPAGLGGGLGARPGGGLTGLPKRAKPAKKPSAGEGSSSGAGLNSGPPPQTRVLTLAPSVGADGVEDIPLPENLRRPPPDLAALLGGLGGGGGLGGLGDIMSQVVSNPATAQLMSQAAGSLFGGGNQTLLFPVCLHTFCWPCLGLSYSWPHHQSGAPRSL
jgi:hypothetical protein